MTYQFIGGFFLGIGIGSTVMAIACALIQRRVNRL